MAQENELQALRDELKKIQDDTRRSRTRAAVGFVVLILIMILSLGYAFLQRTEAVKQREMVNQQRILVEASEKHAMMAAAEARRQQVLAEEGRQMAEARAQELEKCCKKR